MIARVWKGYTVPEKAPLYLEHLRHNVFPELDQIEGFRGANVLQREEDDNMEFIVTTYWQSIDAIEYFIKLGAEVGVAAQTFVYSYDAYIRVYEMALQK